VAGQFCTLPMLLFPQLEQVKHCNAFGGIAVVVATSVMI